MNSSSVNSVDTSASVLEASDGSIATNISSLERLLGTVEEARHLDLDGVDRDEALVSARLGVASALFTALRAKHAPTAQHCLRVAIRSSAFARMLGLPSKKIDDLEIAALLHDIGKIGVPDSILTKPVPLNDEELAIMGRQWVFGQKILSRCVADLEVLGIVQHSAARFDGMGQKRQDVVGTDIPLGARLLAIADAFDAMTTDHVYRPAMSRELAISELFRFAGSQFDPDLVRGFAEVSPQLEATVCCWNEAQARESGHAAWRLRQPISVSDERNPELLFQHCLLHAMPDGVIFVDASRRIVRWNQGAERLTGMSSECVLDKTWNCQFLDLRDSEDNALHDAQCPIEHVLQQRVQMTFLGSILQPNESRLCVEMRVSPVMDDSERGVCHGVTMLLRDVSSEADLRDRVQDLHEQATTDPLTGLSNRAAFDRAFNELVASCIQNGPTCSIVITDIDCFKQVNDVYGHQAGDEVLVSFASLLRRLAREADLVARYGGEEFVILCPECDNAAATKRADVIRRELARVPHPSMNQETVTASFGVTELQRGDDPETMLRRADRALYQAKDAGRNRVVQLGAGFASARPNQPSRWPSWLQRKRLDPLVARSLMTNVPIEVLAEKIRGFIADHGAEIISIEQNEVVLLADSKAVSRQRRQSDRPVALVVELSLTEVQEDPGTGWLRQGTLVGVKIRPRRTRDRRSAASHQADQILASLRSYLIAHDV